MNQEEFRVEIVKHMATTNERLKVLDEHSERLENKVDEMSINGTAKCGENGRRLDKLEIAPQRNSLAGGAMAGGGIAAVIVGIIKGLEAIL
jgi:hypothetical protein